MLRKQHTYDTCTTIQAIIIFFFFFFLNTSTYSCGVGYNVKIKYYTSVCVFPFSFFFSVFDQQNSKQKQTKQSKKNTGKPEFFYFNRNSLPTGICKFKIHKAFIRRRKICIKRDEILFENIYSIPSLIKSLPSMATPFIRSDFRSTEIIKY